MAGPRRGHGYIYAGGAEGPFLGVGMNSVFTEQILAEKLSKLNSSQQCIETLSHWCIFHRSKAEQVVATWDKQFHSLEMAQKVPLLYLANDILQNSKRKGNEFVTEFWKVLPSALKQMVEKGDDRGTKVVSRLVDIWEERRVFGSRAQNLKAIMLGEEVPAPLEFGRKRSRSVKIIKRDSRSIKTKLTIGGMAEKIVSAFHLVLSENSNEDEEMNKCKSAVSRVRKMEEDVEVALSRAKDPKRKTLSKGLEAEENILKQSLEKLKVVEANRLTLVSQLRDALNEQESELENVRTQMQVAQAQLGESSEMRRRLDDENFVTNSNSSTAPESSSGETTKKSTKRIAAEVADMLTASSSSQYIMSSVLSTFAAEAAKTAQLAKSSTSSDSFSSLPNSTSNNSAVFKPEQTMSQNNLYQIPPSTMQTQIPNSQTQYLSLANAPSHQYLQASVGIMNSYGYGTFPPLVPPLPPGPPPPAPPPSFMLNPLLPPLAQQPSLQMNQQQPLTMNNQPSHLSQLHSISLPPQPPVPGFRPVAPPNQASGMVYFAPPPHSH
ncbi:hypothetical protein M9H77_19809 [Catharanthus roseus]|uniref:Uncharacterized protein n=1 Tax=Catharanthus roseus TaxID=4058 RepID=A0ACC0BBE1_CATRO|nr:hypothetical protein M9H77_19809 [Catharanthus roseus]